MPRDRGRDWGVLWPCMKVPDEGADSSDPSPTAATDSAKVRLGMQASAQAPVGSSDGASSPDTAEDSPDRQAHRRFLLAADQLAREREVRERAARILVVIEHRLAEARCFGEPHVARNDGAEHLVAEVHEQLRRDLVRQVVPRIEHRAQDALELQVRDSRWPGSARSCSSARSVPRARSTRTASARARCRRRRARSA